MTLRWIVLLAGILQVPVHSFHDELKKVALDEKKLEAAQLKTDGASLLDFFKQRTLSDEEREKVLGWINKLGAKPFREREQASAALIARGPVVVELLRDSLAHGDLEVVRRAEKCIARIKEKDHPPDVPVAAARLLGVRKPAGSLDVLLAYLPFADHEMVADEVRNTLAALAVKQGQPEKVLVAALTDKAPIRRAAAAEALWRAGATAHKAEIRNLLKDPVPLVRWRVAMALTYAKERDAVQVLIDVLPHLQQAQAWQVEDILFRLADGKSPPAVALGTDEASRKKSRDAWDAWWKQHGAAIDLAKLRETHRLLGYTTIVLLDRGRILEVDANKNERWHIDGLMFPLDVQMLPGDRVLVAEYNANRVTERSLKGEILWQFRTPGGPIVAQRRPNGNTFIATQEQLLEVDRNDKQVFTFTFQSGERIMKVVKLDSGEIVCLTDGRRVVRINEMGKEVHSFNVNLNMLLFGGRLHALPNGRVLVPHNGENKVIEYDANGKMVWEVKVEQPVIATRLPNGNTLVTTFTQNRAVEFNRDGQEVWQYQSDTRVTRAVRR